jgi:hypothetical protein
MTRHLVGSRLWAQFRRISSATLIRTRNQLRSRRRNRQDAFECEVLEGRVVLSSGGGGSLFNSLTYVGVVTSPIVVAKVPVGPVFPLAAGAASTAVGQLGSNIQALWTELQTLAAKSDVTVEDLQHLTGDYQSISQAGFHFTTSSLNSVMSELASAVAGGTSTTQAPADFTALFGGSSVSSTVITSTFNDLVTAITDSQVTTADLATVAKDEAAIQSDISNLPGRAQPQAISAAAITADVPVGVVQPISIAGPILNSSVPPIVFQPPIVFGPQPIGPPVYLTAGLFGSLNYVGVVTSPVVVISSTSTTGSNSTSTLKADEQSLQTELQSLAAKSGLTIADLESLALDDQSIAEAGFRFNPSKLNPVISELATAVAGDTSASTAQAEFTALFTGSSVSSTLVTSTFNDLMKAITDSKVTTADLTTVASDEATIQSALESSHHNKGGTGKSGGTGSGTGTTGSGSSGSGTTGTGTTGTGTGTTGTGTTGSGTTGTSTGGKHGHGHHVTHGVRPLAHAHGRHGADDLRKRK